MENRSLFLHPWPISGDDRAKLVAAKQKLGLDFMVVPQRAFVEDEEGWKNLCVGRRVLCLRESSPMIADHALVRDMDNEESLLDALEWALTNKVDSRASTLLGTLAGFGYKEIPNTDLRYERLSKNLGLNDSSSVPMFRSTEEEVDTNE